MRTSVQILSYNSGNIASIINAFDYINVDTKIITKSTELLNELPLIIPGVGVYEKAMNYLLRESLYDPIRNMFEADTPILGVCLGLQIFSEFGYEYSKTKGLNFIEGSVKHLNSISQKKLIKCPHIGWSKVKSNNNNLPEKINKIIDENYFYFVHSYGLILNNSSSFDFYGTTSYESTNFTSMVINGNLMGTQFHPEKSGECGIEILKYFVEEIVN
ncbi:imidazole glycerol phosphate synthase subunit HisH [Prochlorococcus marinus]|uniref:imidazole glycerol phosphate synthase subunit HisH n=1 Tax=Prochlorococcus marinus TaxID=1219 RepID=UPI0039B01775